MNSKDKAILEEMNRQHKANSKEHKATETPLHNQQQNPQKTPGRTTIADAMGLNETERQLVGLTSDLKSQQMLRLVESETLRKFGEGLQVSCGIVENLNAQLEGLQSYEFTLEDAAFLLSGQPLTHIKMLSGSGS